MATYQTRNGRTGKRGLFLQGVWQCDCEPRLPADKFQVKNGGKNHGRWFYTCQKPQHKRCKFFLWSDDAKIREEAAVLTNSRSEPTPLPKTPQKAAAPNAAPVTPQTLSRTVRTDPSTINLAAQTPGKDEREESFDWSSSNDEALLEAEQEVLVDKALPETPKKTPRTASLTSPGKRTISQTSAQRGASDSIWPLSDDVFATPSSYQSDEYGLLSPSKTPANKTLQAALPGPGPGPETSTLASDVMEILSDSHISSKVEQELVELLNKHDLRTQGIMKGRDITRLAVQAKEKKIAELQARISMLEAERETNRRVISHLKSDIATSPKRGKGKGFTPSRRSEV